VIVRLSVSLLDGDTTPLTQVHFSFSPFVDEKWKVAVLELQKCSWGRIPFVTLCDADFSVILKKN